MSGSESSSLPALIAQLASANADERAEAAELLCRAGTEAVAATLPLVEACGDDDSRVREWAVAALEELGAPPAEIIDQLAEIASSPEPLGAYWAATLLGRAGGDAAAAVPANLAEQGGPGQPRQTADNCPVGSVGHQGRWPDAAGSPAFSAPGMEALRWRSSPTHRRSRPWCQARSLRRGRACPGCGSPAWRCSSSLSARLEHRPRLLPAPLRLRPREHRQPNRGMRSSLPASISRSLANRKLPSRRW